jgi:hypothetical protein
MMQTRISLDETTDRGGARRRYVGRRYDSGKKDSEIVREAWDNRNKQPSRSTNSKSVNPPDHVPDGIEYDPDEFDGATPEQILDAINTAAQAE